VNSRPRRAGYSRGNFSVMPGPHPRGHERSLGPGFPPAPLAFKGAVSPAFGLALYGGVLTRLSRALGTPDTFSGVCRPSQTAHLPLSPGELPRVRGVAAGGRCFIGASTPPREGVSSLPPTLRTRSYAPTAGCGEAPRGLLAPSGVPGLCTRLRVHRVPGWDSGDLVDPFMRAGTYPARHLATLRESELLPAFSGASPGCTRVSRTASGQDSAPVHTLSGSRGPMFLLNSRVPLVTATCGPRVDPRTAGTPSPEVTGPICRVP